MTGCCNTKCYRYSVNVTINITTISLQDRPTRSLQYPQDAAQYEAHVMFGWKVFSLKYDDYYNPIKIIFLVI